MPSKLKRSMKTKKNRDFWAGVDRACKEYKGLPKWQREIMEARRADMEEGWKQPATCAHCGQETKGRCRPCYG